jgi:S-DNA-T family DNA segregation ATPase FtsK/SpoIIIE
LTSAAANGSAWKLPAIADILESGSDQDTNNAAIREQVEIIEHTLESFGAPATIVEINQGPTITQFGVEPNYLIMRNGKRTKVKVGKIAGLADDLALALAARSIRIQAPVPGKGYVGIEVPNSSKALVSLRDIMESPDFGRIRSTLRIGLGQNVAGQPISTDLAGMPHLLIAGTTGAGKSVCVNGIIACLLLLNTPDDLRLVMIDPKRVELTGYNGIPHLAAPVVVEMDRVIGTLQWALREMDHRYKLFAEAGARNIADFNKKMRQQRRSEKLPYIVIIVDELADLMMLAPEDTERSVTRLAQMARATGIHMIISTQRPSVDVVTGLIKANFPARIAFAVASSTDSRVILDTTGAERLLGQGDMLFQSPDAAAPVRLQGCFVSDNELNKLIHYWQTARRENLIPASESIAPRPVQAKPGTLVTPMTIAADKPAPHPERVTRAARGPGTGQSTATGDEPTVVTTPPPPATKREQDQEPRPQPPSIKPKLRSSSPQPEQPPAEGNKRELIQQPLWEALQELDEQNGNDISAAEEDELLAEAIALARKLNKASTSMLQRRFRIGYTRAARLIDAMEERGIIGPPTGTSKAREVIGAEGTATEDSEAAGNDKHSNEDTE